MTRFWRCVEIVLRPFDGENHEFVVRLRLWRARWFGTRVAEFKGMGDDGELLLGPWRDVSPTSCVFGHTTTCAVWRGPWNRCDCMGQKS